MCIKVNFFFIFHIWQLNGSDKKDNIKRFVGSKLIKIAIHQIGLRYEDKW